MDARRMTIRAKISGFTATMTWKIRDVERIEVGSYLPEWLEAMMG